MLSYGKTRVNVTTIQDKELLIMSCIIRCGKYGDSLYSEPEKLSPYKIRLFSKNPNKVKTKKYTPISTDGKFVLYNDTISDINSFIKYFENVENPIVLTHKEYEFFLKIECSLFKKIHVFETLFPIYPNIKYIENINKSYTFLCDKLKKVKNIGGDGSSLTKHFSIKDKFHIEKKLKFKNSLDSIFYFALTHGYQEVFKFKEEREERVVVALDFNSMYASCMDGDFIEPKSIRHKYLADLSIEYDKLPTGLYRVIFKRPKSEFFKSFHPFKYNVMGKKFNFNLSDNDFLEVLIFKEELDYYVSFFEDYRLIEVFYSPKTVKHPLYKNAARVYQERLAFKKDGNDAFEQMSKLKLAIMHSATNPVKNFIRNFSSSGKVIDFVIKNYGFSFESGMKKSDHLQIIENTPSFSLSYTEKNRSWCLTSPDLHNFESVYSISAKVVSIAKLKMVKVIERFLKHKSVEICYSNTDSVHISILKDELGRFLDSHADVISSKIGDLKIQSISKKGYWFDVGRYWLVDDNEVIQYKNIIFKNKHSSTKFDKFRKISSITLGSFFNFTTVKYKYINNAFSYRKRVIEENSSFERYSFHEICNMKNAEKSYCNELLSSKRIKSDLFEKLATKYDC